MSTYLAPMQEGKRMKIVIIDIALEIEDESQYMDVYGILSRVFNCDVDILLVNDLLNPRTNIGTLVKKNFLHDRVLIYQ